MQAVSIRTMLDSLNGLSIPTDMEELAFFDGIYGYCQVVENGLRTIYCEGCKIAAVAKHIPWHVVYAIVLMDLYKDYKTSYADAERSAECDHRRCPQCQSNCC